ncbi:MBL fold metallo-hydrolase [Enterococcus lemanii]|uniref:MBL fold metallo-hydrolase n=1 Tax=Enterococcus lemanii TaxID=1159752 RepID=A0ABV9MUU4_9ENTE|nr:MBL fold metallo-hydrolase [Enterococcus lemanii]MBM7709330.1 glyoxylase-like metal-dependent hydrolase (beta-lactamase superfamily II) [Enterococcus lemanii]
MQIQQIPTGPIQENCYLIWQQQDLLIIDPGADAHLLKEQIKKNAAHPLAILLTHTHYDHIGAVEELRAFYNIPVYVSPLENNWLANPLLNLSSRHPELGGIVVQPAEHELELRGYKIGSIEFQVVATPGHSHGSLSFIFEDFVVSGDALFKGSIGRTDLHTGNLEQLIESIQTQLFTLPDHYEVFPGHGEPTTIAWEKQTNPFFNR